MNGFKAGFVTFIGENGSDFAGTFKLGMFVIRIAAKELNLFNRTIKVKGAIYIKTCLVKIDSDDLLFFLFAFFTFFLFSFFMSTWNAVIRVKFMDSNADKPALAYVRGACRKG